MLLVPDLTQDERFAENVAVTGEPNMRFYAGMPLVTPKGHAIGTFCAVDFEKREISLNRPIPLKISFIRNIDQTKHKMFMKMHAKPMHMIIIKNEEYL